MSKNICAKASLDTLDFIEYFCTEQSDPKLVWTFVGYIEAIIAISNQTMNQVWSNKIADKLGLDHVVLDSEVPQKTINFLNTKTNILKDVVACEYLCRRKFPLNLIERYGIYSYTPVKYGRDELKEINPFYLFNHDRLEYLNYILAAYGISDVDLTQVTFLVIPSYDRFGGINNFAFRPVNCSTLEEKVFKWLFSHGRCATFGLHNCTPDKPVTIVEGFFDYVACNEIGITQPVGLGSAFFSDLHLEYLENFKLDILFDSDETGKKYNNQLDNLNVRKQFTLDDDYKDPYDWWINTGEIKYT